MNKEKLKCPKNIKEQLDKEQLAAVESPIDQNTVVRAVAGSGKTRALTCRVASVLENGYDPSQVLLLTFTNKAAAEMKERINELIGSTARIDSGTFHSVAVRHLRRYSSNKDFSIIDQKESVKLLKTVLDYELEKEEIPKKEFYTAAHIANIYSMSINHKESIDEIMNNMDAEESEIKIIKKVLRGYVDKKEIMNLMDFDDLIVEWYKMLQVPHFAEKIQERYKYIFVDEYQDINWIQDGILHALVDNNFGASLFAIGDASQCIYQFRGSQPSYIENFEDEYEDPAVYSISTNYRSNSEVLEAAETLINNNTLRYPLVFNSFQGKGGNVSVEAFADDYDQARWIAEDIVNNVSEEDLHDVAILVRTRKEMFALRNEFIKLNLPAEFHGLFELKESKHIVDYMSYVRSIFNPFNYPAMIRFLNLYPGIGAVSAENMFNDIADNGGDFDKTLTTYMPGSSNHNAIDALIEGKELINSDDPDKFTKVSKLFLINYDKNVLRKEGVRMDENTKSESIEGLSKLFDHLSSDGSEPEDVVDSFFLDDKEEEEDLSGKVQVMTMHKSKGLEWKRVYIIGLTNGLFPLESKDEQEIEDERNLMYVAITRAREECIMTFPMLSYKFRPYFSQFVSDAGYELEAIHSINERVGGY